MNTTAKDLFDQAIQAYKIKNLPLAEQHCLQVIALNPLSGDAYNLLGLIHNEKKEFQKAISFFRRALKCTENNPVYMNNLAGSLLASGKTAEAISTASAIIAQLPSYYQAWFTLAKCYRTTGETDKAIEHFEKTISLKPGFVPALNNLANILQKENKITEALSLYLQALEANPNYAEIHCNVGNIYKLQGNTARALEHYQSSVKINPAYWMAYVGLGNLYLSMNDSERAQSCYLKVLEYQPNHRDCLLILGDMHRKAGNTKQSLELFLRILQTNANDTVALLQAGMAYYILLDYEKAKQYFTRVLEIDPANTECKFTLGKLNEQEKNYTRSVQLYEEVLQTNNRFNVQVLYELVLLKLRMCDWTNYHALLNDVITLTTEYLAQQEWNFNLTPLTLNYLPLPPQLHAGVAARFAQVMESDVASIRNRLNFSHDINLQNSNLQNTKLRIGYLSPDFRLHAVGLLLRDVFAHHNRSQVEVYLYSIANPNDEYNQAFRQSADVFRDISATNYEEAARIIHQDGIHVLIDLAGYTTHCRPQILALQPAPVQVLFMGYPNSTGSSYTQYIIGDKWLLPEEIKSHYTEKFIHLSQAFVSSEMKISQRNFSKTELGLPENAFVYCCFNSVFKISPRVFEMWMYILQSAPDSVLWLSRENEFVEKNLKAEAVKYGINPQRLVFSTWLPMDEYLASYRCADVFLDTFYYSAGSTAVCALHAGVPVLTYAGKTNSSRMGASIVASAGLTEMIAESEEMYLQKAIELYQNKELLLSVKNKLKLPSALPLFNASHFISELENQLFSLFNKHI